MNDKQILGRWGEEFTAKYLSARAYTIIERNARTPYGEIDIVARQEDIIVFVEVKTRTSTAFGYPEEAITATKREHMIQSAQAYLQNHPKLDTDWRIDVVAIQRKNSEKIPQIKHFENAVN
ncbi:MAG: YraN family protein [Chloroflexota bacterium]|nr:YraN family protein [Chloroflexota bacterium]